MSLEGKKSESWNLFSTEQWIAWLISMGVGIAGVTSFFYMNFATRDALAEHKMEEGRFETELSKRLDRIENKIDLVLQK